MSVMQRESLTMSPAETALMEAKANQEVTRQLCLGLGSPNRRIAPSAVQHTGSIDDLSSFGVYDDLQKPGAVPSKQVSQQTLSVLAHPHLAAKPLMVTATLNRHRRRPPPFSKAASNDDILCEKSNTAQSNHYDNPRSKNWENGSSSNSGITGVGGPLAAVASNGPTPRPFLLADSRGHDCRTSLLEHTTSTHLYLHFYQPASRANRVLSVYLVIMSGVDFAVSGGHDRASPVYEPIAMEIFDYEAPMGTIKEHQQLGHQTMASTSWREADRFEPRARIHNTSACFVLRPMTLSGLRMASSFFLATHATETAPAYRRCRHDSVAAFAFGWVTLRLSTKTQQWQDANPMRPTVGVVLYTTCVFSKRPWMNPTLNLCPPDSRVPSPPDGCSTLEASNPGLYTPHRDDSTPRSRKRRKAAGDDHFYLDNEDCTTKFDGDSSCDGAEPNGVGQNSRDDTSATSDDATSRGDTSSAYNFSYRVVLPPPERKFL
ncbi:Down syndrome cell adhesion molecule protein Dscam2-like [Tropilaelaps mercedesae]|uniref:Down syndrome cell adhesion molecule protein Dscam2-like n=1 Tax=Tropilaelaps mercedesae TaxID=418985 RepID=A0A1V9X2T7_9ACAR|nr:Down syndrome cell adhesion molecule protein Dscam2-like [Tropilaelaps mercedesae]